MEINVEKFVKDYKRMCSNYPSCQGCPNNDALCNINDLENTVLVVQKRAKENSEDKMARKPERLDSFYDKLKEIHKTYVPDWRVGQLMYNFIRDYGDPYYLEEDAFLAAIEDYIRKGFN